MALPLSELADGEERTAWERTRAQVSVARVVPSMANKGPAGASPCARSWPPAGA